ncbi:MAG: DUF4296 domain-containing protein [Ginsengibacter sp.]
MKTFLFVISTCIWISCSDKNKTPPGIIPLNEMSRIMWDIIRAQSFANETSRKDSSINVESQTKALTKKVFEIHNVSSSLFDKSYDWYSSHPDILRIMFDSLYSQKQRESDLQMKEKYKHLGKDSLPGKFLKK